MKSARQSTRRRKLSPEPGEWTVVPVEGAPIREKARRDYQKVLLELERAKADAERFENEDKPRFSKWMNANFGSILTEIRELQERLLQVQGLVDEVQEEFFVGNYRSVSSAYKNVMKRRETPEEAEPPPEEFTEEEAKQFRRDFEEVFGKTEEEFWERTGPDPEKIKQRNSKERLRQNSSLKDLYRKLVRRLHPDKGAERSGREIEWWHQTQDAYENGNIEQLELIQTLVEMEDRGSQDASVSALSQLTTEFKKSLRALKRKLVSFKRDLAWNFSQLTDFSSLSNRVLGTLKADREQIVWLLEKYEKQVQSWQTSARAPRKRVQAGRGAWQDEEWF